MKFTNKYKNEIDNKLNDLFDEWVPGQGKAENQAGELIRATMKIQYAYFNNGERIFQRDWHNESTDKAADFLWSHTNSEIKALIDLGEKKYDAGYERFLYQLAEAILKFIDENPELKEREAIDFLAQEKREPLGSLPPLLFYIRGRMVRIFWK